MSRSVRKTAGKQPSLAAAKQKLDAELAEYASVRKQEIKELILAENATLTTLQAESASLQTDIDKQKAELTELSQVYIDEQAAIRLSTEEKDRIIADNTEAVAVAKRELDTVTDEIRAAIYERDRVLLITDKSREEHNKFLTYEKRARQILEDKDRELQSKAAEVTQANQFLKSRRSFLPEL